MNMSPHAHGSSRFTGIGLVAFVHVVMAWALIHGLIQHKPEAPKPPIVLRPAVDEAPPLPKPIDPLPLPRPTLSTPNVQFVPPPDLPSSFEAAPSALTATASDQPSSMASNERPSLPAGPVAQAAPIAATGPVTPRSVCTKMGTPEAPSVNWSGEALFKVIATVKAGRVVATEVRALRGGFDAKTRRALQSAIESTLRDSYECPGNHQFEQEFQFRID